MSSINTILYISTFAVLGACTRVLLSRIFGEDCEDSLVDDFLTPFSSQICVTAGGRTLQAGGAVFRDLPANILGSFIMGLITPIQHNCRLPWYQSTHHLQHDEAFYAGIGTGFCGSLTTYASWNSQLVAMLDGSHCDIGVQVAPALCGYLIGVMTSVSGFRAGRELSVLIHDWKEKTSERKKHVPTEEHGSISHQASGASADEDDAVYNQVLDDSMTRADSPPDSCTRPVHLYHMLAFVLLGLFILAATLFDMQFYRNMVTMTIAAPMGALGRWKLSELNKRQWETMAWLPRGTLGANWIGALVSIVCVGILDRYSETAQLRRPGVLALLFAIRTGFAGSLSTVSTMVKEIVSLSEKYPGHAKSHLYASITIVGGMILSLLVYMLTVRVGLP